MTSDLPANPNNLLDLAKRDPVQALSKGLDLLQRADGSVSDQAKILRSLCFAARLGGTMEESISFGRRAVEAARNDGDVALLVDTLITLSGSLAISGDNAEALQTLGLALDVADGLQVAEVEFQRAAVLARMGRWSLATTALDDALPVFVEAGDTESVAMTHHNRGMLYMEGGQMPAAVTDLSRALELFHQLGHASLEAGVQHGLGRALALQGDLPGAMAAYATSERRFNELVGSAAEVQASRCETLLSAGLFSEALALAMTTAQELRTRGLFEDLGETKLVGAHAALLVGKSALAVDLSRSAAQLFEDQGRTTWRANARQVELASQFESGEVDIQLAADARQAADELADQHQFVGSFNARMTAGLAALTIGEQEQGVRDLRLLDSFATGPVEIRLQSWLAKSLIESSLGNTRSAISAARAGMRLLSNYQAALVATDVRSGIEKHARRLADQGLRLVLGSKHPRRVFEWMELGRARALNVKPVRPPRDLDQAADLVALRQLGLELRSASGPAADRLSRAEIRLQESVKVRVRTVDGATSSWNSPDLVKGVTKALAGETLVEYAAVDGQMWAVVVRNGRFSLRPIGEFDTVQREVASLRFSLRSLARGRGDVGNSEAIARQVDDLLVAPLKLGPGEVVVVPTPEMYATPWSVLPSMVGRSVTVSPSAEMWTRLKGLDSANDPVVVAAGPDLEHVDSEVLSIAALHPQATVALQAQSKVSELLRELEGAGIAHIASHGEFRANSPMFSSLRLGDGDLNVYDIEQLRHPPNLMVLSACDSGFSDTHPGEELLGLASALLAMGTKTVVASVGLVPDSSATMDLMVRFHRGVLGGLAPAVALRESQDSIQGTAAGYSAAANFLCIGA